MAKKNNGNRGRQQSNQHRQSSNPAKEVGVAISSAAPESPMMRKIGDVVTEEGLENELAEVGSELPKDVNHLSVVEAYKRHVVAADLYEKEKESLKKSEEKLNERNAKLLERESAFVSVEDHLKKRELELGTRRKELDESARELEQRVSDVSKKKDELDNRERSLAKKEQDLLTGRLSEAFEIYVQPLEEKRSQVLTQISDHIGKTQESVRIQWVKILGDLEEGNESFRQDLRLEIKELAKDRLELTAKQSALDIERELLKEGREKLDKERQKVYDTQSEEIEARKDRLEQEYRSKRESLDRREVEALSIISKSEFITEWEDTLGDIKKVADEISNLKATILTLEAELATRRSLKDGNEMRNLKKQLTDLTEEITFLREDNQAKIKESAVATSRFLDAEAKFDEVENWKSTIEQYRKQRDQLKVDMDHLSGVKKAESPFSECSSMDVDPQLQLPSRHIDDLGIDLSKFVDRMQWLLFNPLPDSKGVRPLSYQKDHLRIFVAGLNTSRLHILEGVSGTGKTTLPIAFVRALGGGETNVAIQAGWRDRQDLLGYFNEFQGQFRETDFLRGVYRAMTPRFCKSPYFVILDEMNLSKVEQYFADYLKGLEDAAGADVERGGSIPLMDRSGITLPRHLHEGKNGGVELPLPPNVWFIGTANQDESTQSFAPKTQSRAHIMELPYELPSDQAMESEIAGQSFGRFQPDSLGFEALQQAFKAAELKPQNRAHTEKSREIFTELRKVIANIDDGLALGPRFNRQVDSFVPIIIETGGTLSLAIDHLVSTKFIRRMNENYKITAKHRKILSDSLDRVWRDNALGDYSKTRASRMLNLGDHA